MSALRFIDKSPLQGVSLSAWKALVATLEVQSHNEVSQYGGLGAYDIRPRRLVEIGRAKNLRRADLRQECDFVEPWTKERFLADPTAQYAVLVKSMRLYYDALRSGVIKKPEGLSISGALAVLHVGGTAALEEWPELSFKNTKKLCEAAQGAF